MSMRVSASVDSALPLRGYVLSVGGALLGLLLAADWAMPAPQPSRFTQSETVLPQIRIRSDVKLPEPVIINTNQPPPMLSFSAERHGIEVASAVPDAGLSAPVNDSESHTAPPATSQHDQNAARSPPPGETGSERGNRPVPSGSEKRRSALHSRHDSTSGRCNASHRAACHYALMPSRAIAPVWRF